MVKNIALIGQKAKNLIILSSKFPEFVPHFEIIELDKFFTNWRILNIEINQLAVNFINGKISEKQYLNKLDVFLKLLKVDDNYISQLAIGLDKLGFKRVSYRTSSILEDLKHSSFAGQYITFLNQDIKIVTVKKCVSACVKSLYSLRVLNYVKTHGYLKFHQGGSVIVQEMFYGQAAGVIFTENGSNQMDVAYNLSWKNNVVEGGLSNNFTFNKTNNNLISELPVGLSKSMLRVIDMAKTLEQDEKKPLDIEWSITNDKIAILQFRPLTVNIIDYMIEWDNTNIAESYPGITLPLTYSFIRRVYSKVYPEFLKLLGKTDSELSVSNNVFDNMLGYMGGRVYYNINNWYRLVALVPGYRFNKDFFESMLMPAKKSQTLKKAKKKMPLTVKLNLGITAVRFIWLLLQTNKLSNEFTKEYLLRYKIYKSVLWEKLNAIEIINTYNKIEMDLLKQWAVPILNDFRTMVFHGILRKVYFPRNNDDLYVQLLSGIYDHTSIEPIRELGVLAKIVKKTLNEFNGNQEKTKQAILTKNKYKNVRSKIEEYLSKYGGRSPDELKLENPRLSESMDTFVSFIVSSASGYSDTNNITSKKMSIDVEKKVSYGKSRINKLFLMPFFKFVLYQTKSGISKRERFRFYRAQVFGLARDAYLALGNRFVAAGLIKRRDDIFYLTIEEIQDVILGHAFDYSFIKIINERRKIFLNFEKQNIGRRIISSGLVAPLNTTTDKLIKNKVKDKIIGLGVSKGIFKGKVIIVREFDPKVNVKGKVLVTEHTDPGWTLLFLNAAALIVERGNALSHASIVSREIGIPAVVAAENACSRLKNNDTVIVNGSTGEVTIL